MQHFEGVSQALERDYRDAIHGVDDVSGNEPRITNSGFGGARGHDDADGTPQVGDQAGDFLVDLDPDDAEAGDAISLAIDTIRELVELVRTLDWKLGKLVSVAFAPDGSIGAAGTEDGKIVVWDVDS